MEREPAVLSGGIGARVRRKEDARFLDGRGNFVGDMKMQGQQEVVFLRSPVARGRIRSFEKPTGHEQAVFVAADLDGMLPIVATSTVPSYRVSEQFALARGVVRYVGEPIAICIGATRAVAEDISEKASVDIEELLPLVDMRKARDEKLARVHDSWPDNIFLTFNCDTEFDRHSANAPIVVKQKVSLSRQAIMPMEGKAVLAYWDDRADQLVVYTATQTPHVIRAGISKFLGIDHHQLRVIAPDVGGGFGYKVSLHTEELCVAWLAKTFRRPFRYIEDMRETLIISASAREHEYTMTAYATQDGKLLAIDAEVMINAGAYSYWPWSTSAEAGMATFNLPGPYVFPGFRCQTYSVATNKPPLLSYRGIARTGICFAMELTIDAVARAAGREPWEVRLENLVPLSAMPYDNVTLKHFDSGDYQNSLLRAKQEIKFDSVRKRQQQSEPDGRLIGVGFATYCEGSATGASVYRGWGMPISPGYEQATIRATPDGSFEVRVGLHSHGQGLETTLAQIANKILGVDISRIRVIHGDTGQTPYSTGTYASRSIVMAGGAVAEACEALIPRFAIIGAHLLQCNVSEAHYADGRVVGPGGASVSLKEISESWYLQPYTLPDDVDLRGLEATSSYRSKVDTGAFSFGTHAAVVAVDTDLGEVEILDYVIVEDCGTQVNPMVVEGQTIGGAAQGIGTALYEEMQYDLNGQPNSSTLADYLLPGATEVPAFRIFHTETPSPYTKFGIKGMGEGGAIAPPAVIFNAVNDALKDLGVELNQTPLTPRRLLEAIEKSAHKSPVAGRAV